MAPLVSFFCAAVGLWLSHLQEMSRGMELEIDFEGPVGATLRPGTRMISYVDGFIWVQAFRFAMPRASQSTCSPAGTFLSILDHPTCIPSGKNE